MNLRNQTDVVFADGTDQDDNPKIPTKSQFPGDKMPQKSRVKKTMKKRSIKLRPFKEHR
jgi:hypothetical protein